MFCIRTPKHFLIGLRAFYCAPRQCILSWNQNTDQPCNDKICVKRAGIAKIQTSSLVSLFSCHIRFFSLSIKRNALNTQLSCADLWKNIKYFRNFCTCQLSRFCRGACVQGLGILKVVASFWLKKIIRPILTIAKLHWTSFWAPELLETNNSNNHVSYNSHIPYIEIRNVELLSP